MARQRRDGEPMLDVFVNIRLTTADKDPWGNARQMWAVGTASMATGKLNMHFPGRDQLCRCEPLSPARVRRSPPELALGLRVRRAANVGHHHDTGLTRE